MTQPKIEGPKYGKPIMPYGSDGTNWIAVLIDALGHLQVDVVSAALGSGGATEATLLLIKGYVDALETLLAGGLPAALDTGALKVKEQSPLTGFATSANQATMVTALQLIDDLRNALGSVDTDDLQVDVKTYPGVNALLNIPFGYYDRYLEQVFQPNAIAGSNYLLGSTVPAGEIWVIGTMSASNVNHAPSGISLGIYDGATYYTLAAKAAPAAAEWVPWSGLMIAKQGDRIFAWIGACTLNDDLFLNINGYKMKVA